MKAIKAPKVIYLQDGDPEDPDFEPLADYEGVTWCQDQINDGDTKYIRFDEHERLLREASPAYVSQPSEYPWTESGHPWADFLQARKRAIEWMNKEGWHDIVIREALSMDEEQIRLIRMGIAEDLPYKQCPVCGLEASRPECHDQNCPL